MTGKRRTFRFNWVKSDPDRGEVLISLRGPKHGYHLFYLSEAEMNTLVHRYLDVLLRPADPDPRSGPRKTN